MCVCVYVCVWSRGGVFLPDCIIKLLRQALSALSCLFSSHFPLVVEPARDLLLKQ